MYLKYGIFFEFIVCDITILLSITLRSDIIMTPIVKKWKFLASENPSSSAIRTLGDKVRNWNARNYRQQQS